MIRAIQCINWSLLDPSPVALEGPVIAVLGQNGSCKSSFMDAAKALLGARSFGQGRSVGSYRYTGRGGAPPAKRAYVLGLFDRDERLGSIKSSQFTVILEASSSQRRFLVLEGDHLIRGDVEAGLVELRESYPRSRWMRPTDYAKRFLEPIGIGPAMRRFLELPQGEIGRAMDRDARRLVALLLELCGGRDAAESFSKAEDALEEARASQRNVERKVEHLKTRLAEARLDAAEARQICEQRHRLAQLLAQIDLLPEPGRQGGRREEPSRPLILGARRRRELGLVLEGGYWRVPVETAGAVSELLGPGESLPLIGSPDDGLVQGPRHDETSADEGPDDRPDDKQLRELKEIGSRIRAHDIEESLGEGLVHDDVGELLGAARAILAQGIPDLPDASDVDAVPELEAQLDHERGQLERKEEVLREATEQLAKAREIYVEAARRALEAASERFSVLCNHAGLRGEMEVAATSDGVECRISASEDVDGELRPLHGARNSLSGGWRASVIVLAVLACLSSEGSTPMLLIDEVGASLDEERLQALGEAFATLGIEEGLLTMITVPSKTVSQTVATFASQQIAFFRPQVEEPLAPPPHAITRVAQLRAA